MPECMRSQPWTHIYIELDAAVFVVMCAAAGSVQCPLDPLEQSAILRLFQIAAISSGKQKITL